MREVEGSARPGTANHAASPVSHRLTSAPAATAVEATVNAWLARSGSSAPAVLMTSLFMPRPCYPALTTPPIDSLAMEAVFITLMALVVVLASVVALIVLGKLVKATNR